MVLNLIYIKKEIIKYIKILICIINYILFIFIENLNINLNKYDTKILYKYIFSHSIYHNII